MVVRFLITKLPTGRYYAGMKDGKAVFHHIGTTPEQEQEIVHFTTYGDAEYEIFNTLRHASEKGERFIIEKHFIN